MEDFIVTTARRPSVDTENLAAGTAARLGIEFVERGDFSLDALKKIHGVENILIAKNNLLSIEAVGGEIFFHPNTAHLRIKNIRRGEGDRLISAGKIKSGDKILDCTLGLGSDAIVESFVVGAGGGVTALEINPALAEVVRYGMKNFAADTAAVVEAMRRVEVVTADYAEFLRAAADDSFDVVYFDPMFRHALEKSSAINPIRAVANHAPLELEAVREACRVARRCVVMKENSRSTEFERLGFRIADGGRYSPVAFGVIEL